MCWYVSPCILGIVVCLAHTQCPLPRPQTLPCGPSASALVARSLPWWLGLATDLLPQGNMRHLTGLVVEALDGSFLPLCVPPLESWGVGVSGN